VNWRVKNSSYGVPSMLESITSTADHFSHEPKHSFSIGGQPGCGFVVENVLHVLTSFRKRLDNRRALGVFKIISLLCGRLYLQPTWCLLM